MGAIFDSDFEITEVQCVAEGDEECSFNVVRMESLPQQLAFKSE